MPDTPPADDSQLFAPPPVAIETEPTEAPEPEAAEGADHERAQAEAVKRLVLSLELHGVPQGAACSWSRAARARTVAKTANRTLKPGRHTLELQLSRKRWPTALRFRTKELTIDETQLAPPSDDTVVSTPSGG